MCQTYTTKKLHTYNLFGLRIKNGKELKVMHFSSSQFGGAGSAAFRLHDSLLSAGVNSNFISRDGTTISEFSFIQRLASSSTTLLQSRLIQKGSSLVTPISLDFFEKFSELAKQADVIHIHATYNLVNYNVFRFAEKTSKLVVCTLHDERFYTGGCHVSNGCKGYLSKCLRCPQVTFIGKKLISTSHSRSLKHIRGVNNIVFIAPSIWIKNQFKSSPFGQSRPIYQIFNPIPDYFFNLTPDSTEPKKRKKVITFISTELNNPIKNLNLLKLALHGMSLKESSNIVLNLVGNGEVNDFPEHLEVNKYGTLTSMETANLLQSTDVVVVPSIVDNSPNIIGESLAAGCYVIGSDIGGIPEALLRFRMPVIDPFNSTDLSREIIDAPLKKDACRISHAAKALFGYSEVSKQVLRIYEANL